MKSLKNRTIGARLALTICMALAAIIAVSVFGLFDMRKLSLLTSDLARDKFTNTVWANNIIEECYKDQLIVHKYILATTKPQHEQLLSEFSGTKANVDAYIDSLNGSLTTEAGHKLLEDFINVRVNEYKPVRALLINAIDTGQKQKAEELLSGKYGEAAHKYISSIKDLVGGVTEQFQAANENALDTYQASVIILVAALVVIVALMTIGGFSITKSIVNPVKLVAERIRHFQEADITDLRDGLLAVSGGDTSVRVENITEHLNLSQADEVGQMAGVVDKMIDKNQESLNAYEKVRATLESLVSEAQCMRQGAADGDLAKRADSGKVSGQYRAILEGFNNTVDEIVVKVRESEAIVEKISQGDLTARMEGDYMGNYKRLQNNTNALSDSLRNVITRVTDAVAMTASSVAEISSSTEEMAAGAQEQSAQAAEVATAVEEMTKTILETTKNASSAAEAAKTAGKTAEESGKVINGTITAMEGIAETVRGFSEKLKTLDKNSDQIGEIIQVIDDIADQTNLLALNAAIEAARAGEQGRGFAVVADEVRRLAERTKQATKEIADKIKNIQGGTIEVVSSFNAGVSEVENGKKLADKAGEALKEIISSSTNVVEIATQVAAASEQQSTAAEQISRNIDAISGVSHESATGIQQIAKATDDLNRLTVDLQNLVSTFKIKDATASETPNGMRRDDSKSDYAVRSNGNLVKSS